MDTESQPELAAAFQIRPIPTLVAVRDGTVPFAQPAALPAAALAEVVTHVRAVDMGAVRAASGSPGRDLREPAAARPAVNASH